MPLRVVAHCSTLSAAKRRCMICRCHTTSRVKMVMEHTSCLEYCDSWQKSWLQSMKAPPIEAMAIPKLRVFNSTFGILLKQLFNLV